MNDCTHPRRLPVRAHGATSYCMACGVHLRRGKDGLEQVHIGPTSSTHPWRETVKQEGR